MSEADANGWRPIATAPKDGTHILVARFGEDIGNCPVEVTYWFTVDYGTFEAVENGLYRHVPDLKSMWNNNGHRATHWQPLPKPPVSA